MDWDNVTKVVVMPQRLSEDGTYKLTAKSFPPHGYHKILTVSRIAAGREEKVARVIATVEEEFSVEFAVNLATIMVNEKLPGIPVEVNDEFDFFNPA